MTSSPPRRPDTRRHDLDWLRVGAFAVLIFYHVGMFYVTWDWHVKSSHVSRAIEPLMAMINPWRLPLLFFISGAALRFLFDARPIGALLADRCRRLLPPLVFGMLVIVVPQAYLELRVKGEIEPGYLGFYARYLTADPSFSIIVPTWNHLWYVAYVLVYTFVIAAMLRPLKAVEAGCGPLVRRLLSARATDWVVLACPAIILVVYRLMLDPYFPATHTLVDDWANHAISLTMLLMGWFAARSEAFGEAVRRRLAAILTVALALAALLFAARLNWADIRQNELMAAGAQALRQCYLWVTILALLGLAQRWLDRPGRAIAYLTEAIFPYYILHQTIIVCVGYALLSLALPATVEVATIILATVAGCVLGHEFLIRRSRRLRILFGLKPLTPPRHSWHDRRLRAH